MAFDGKRQTGKRSSLQTNYGVFDMADWRDNLLEENAWKTYDKPKRDPIGDARTKLLDHIDGTIEAIEKGEVPRGMKVKEAHEGDEKAIGLKMKIGNKVMPLEGRTVLPVPYRTSGAVLKALRKEIADKKFDDDIEAVLDGRVSSTPRKRSSGGGKGWSAERRANYERTIAERQKSGG